MKLKDLSIGKQLMTGFGIVLLLILLLSYFSLLQTKRLANETTTMYEHPLQVRRAIGDLKNDVLEMRLEFRNYLLAENEEDRQTALSNSDFHQKDAEQQFQILQERYLGSKTEIEEARTAFDKWIEVRKSNQSIGKAGNIAQAMDRVQKSGDIGNEREKMLEKIHKIDNFSLTKGEALYKNSVKLHQTLVWQQVFLALVTLIIVFIIIYFILKNIRRPLKSLTKATQRFMDGELDARSYYSSKNEFGLLSSSFNNLADKVKAELINNENAVKLSSIMMGEDDANHFCHSLLTGLLELTNAQLGAVYLLNDEKTKFDRFECIGMKMDSSRSFSAKNFEGEFGTVLSTKKIQHITDIPEDTPFAFSTVSGTFTPREIITIPILSGVETVAIISLATIKSFDNYNLRLLHRTFNTMSARLIQVLTFRKILTFSNLLEQQNRELEAQKVELSAQARELTEQNTELEMQKNQLKEVNKLKTSFLSNMSHELRTPLNSVIALSGVLSRRLNGKVPEEEFCYIDVIERNAIHLLSLINDILDLSRMEAGRDDIERNTFDVNKLIRDLVNRIEPLAVQKSIQLKYSPKESLPLLTSDFNKCEHILQNIVANAIKFTEEGGVEITTEFKNECIHILVTDTGIGIDRKFMPHLFDEFRQADESNSRKNGGTGLGLAISKKNADLLGGTISVESTLGKGSTFTLVLPLKPSIDSIDSDYLVNQPILRKDKEYFHTTPTNKTILLVEDTDAIIIQMKDMLETQGYRILVARNGVEALEQVAKEIPDAMILDLMMPEVDGFEVLQRIRENKETDRLPVMILTAKYISKKELAFLKHNGIHQLIRKGDINRELLMDEVVQMLFPAAKELPKIVKKPIVTSTSQEQVVLIIEDNPDNMLTLKALLGGRFTVLEAEDGKSGLEMARKQQPNLILLDIALPGINGIETFAELKKDTIFKSIPVVVVSASAGKDNREHFMALGFDGYLSKPIDHTLFEQVIKDFLG